MPRRSERARAAALFLLRNALLYFLLVNSFLQLRDQLDLAFQSAAFLVAVLAALWMERSRLRLLPSLLIAAALPLLLRCLFFLVFRAQRAMASAPATDFLFLNFDKDFYPALVPYAVAWLFNFLALRDGRFMFAEAVLNAALLLLVFWSQAGYRLTLYPHPSLFAWALALFIMAEFFVLLLAGTAGRRPGGRAAAHGGKTARGARRSAAASTAEQAADAEGVDGRAVMSFAWILLPLILVFLLFLLGKYGEGAVMAGGGLMRPTLFRFDFAPYVRLESEIRTSDQTVMLFRTEGRAERFLLRRFVLSGYSADQGFFMEKGDGMDEYPSIVPDSPETFPDPGYRDRQDVRQEYYFLTLDPSSLICLNYPLAVTPLKNWKSSSFLRVYRVDSRVMRSMEGPRRVRREPSMPRDALSRYTRTAGNAEIDALARKVTEGKTGYFEKVAAIEGYLKGNYLYSLKPGIAEDGDQLRHFLFVSKKGYCSYFAFSMALMCRSLGIPARVAVGFYVDPRSEVLNFYEVRAFQAHAWVEVWFGGLGWVEFDPTSEQVAPGEEFDPFPGPDPDLMTRLIAEIVKNQTDEEERATRPPGLVGSASRIGAEITRIALIVARLWYVTLPALYALFLFCAKLLPSLPGLASRDPRRRVKASYRLQCVRCAGVGLGRAAAESPREHAARADRALGTALAPLAEAFLKAAFAERFDGEDAAAAAAATAGFRSSWRAAVPWPRRLLGAVTPLTVMAPGAATRRRG